MSTDAGRAGIARKCRVLILASAGLVAGCQTVPTGSPGDSTGATGVDGGQDLRSGGYWLGDAVELGVDQPRILERTAIPDPGQDLLYQLLLAELASVTGRPEQALQAWSQAMQQSVDPDVAKRAAGAALQLRREDIAIEAGRRWVALDPAGRDARQTLGLLLLRSGEVEAAREHFRVLLAGPREEAEQRMALLGSLLAREADADAVLALLSGLADDYPGLTAAQIALARAALRSGDAERAAELAGRALERDFDDLQLRSFYGQALIEAEQMDAAILVFQQLVVDYPDDADVRLQLARVLLTAGRPDDALAEFDALLLLTPDDADLLYTAGLLAVEAERPARARRYFLRLLALDESADTVRFILGRLEEELGDTAAAREWYAQVSGEERLSARFRLARLYAQDGDLEQARAVLVALRQEIPEIAPTIYLLENDLLRDAERYRDGIALMNEALTRYPESIELLYGRALMAAFMKDAAAAETDLRRVLAREPGNVHALNALGYTLVDLTDRVDEGFDLIRRAYELDPESAAILDSMGWALYRLGQHGEALPYLRDAWERMPDGEIGAHYGEVLWAQGRFDEARAIWRAAREIDPDHPVLLDTMRRLDP